jgi:hypothetical protein
VSAKEKDQEEAKSQTRARCAVKKGKSAVARLECRAHCVSKTFAHARACLGKTGTRSCDASIPTEYENLQRTRAVISNSHVRHGGRDARTSHFIRIDHITHDDHDDPYKKVPGYNSYNEV